MQALPKLGENRQSTLMTGAFLGYNHNDVIRDGEMWDMENLSGDRYPVLTQRAKRGMTFAQSTGESARLRGIHGRDQLVFIRGNTVFYNNDPVIGITVDPVYDSQNNEIPVKIVSMGAYVCIWPNKVYFNTIDLRDCGTIDQNNEKSGAVLKVHMCRLDGTDYSENEIDINVNPPQNPHNGKLWIDQSGDNDVLRIWDAKTEEWQEVATSYVMIEGTGIGDGLNEYDAVTISGLESSTDNDRIKEQIKALNGSHLVYKASGDYIIIAGILSQSHGTGHLIAQTVHVDRTAPQLDYICESNNRLWGCKYGMENGVVVNEIRASKLGDFRNWSSFPGTAADSYTASVGTDGPFTGAITQKGYPVFFKEHCIHRVSGNTPASFQINTTMCRGIQPGCWRSAAVVGESIYYKATTGVMMYDGSMPLDVSDAFGKVRYRDARAGALGDKYYISMQDYENNWHLFVLDTKTGLWFREDNTKALGFGQADGDLYFIDEVANVLLTARGTVGTEEGPIHWSATFGMYGTNFKEQKYLSRFNIRMQMGQGTRIHMEIEYDSDGIWHDEGEIVGRETRTFMLPVIPRRCDHLRFRLTGTGMCKIFSISRQLEVGSDG